MYYELTSKLRVELTMLVIYWRHSAPARLMADLMEPYLEAQQQETGPMEVIQEIGRVPSAKYYIRQHPNWHTLQTKTPLRVS